MTGTVELSRVGLTEPGTRAPTGGSIDAVLAGSRFAAYTYAYPHKTAYRAFESPRPLESVWSRVSGPVFLYVHVPFCEVRCGFCNLFTQARPAAELHTAYVEAVERQAREVTEAIGSRPVAQMAFGGGTPTQLPPALLSRLLALPSRSFGTRIDQRPTSVETSPDTASDDMLDLLAEFEVERVSIGIQSFEAAELGRVGRPGSPLENQRALDRIRHRSFAVLNLDLIYGIEGQTVASWLRSLQTALTWQPEEIFLYPLYVRPLTGIGRRDRQWADLRPEMYRQARDFLRAAGYEQFSMRSFRKPASNSSNLRAGPVYRCQSDAMVGLGCGARSYTDCTHYSSEWAVGAKSVQGIVDAWVRRAQLEDSGYAQAEFGFVLDDRERKIRHLLQSLLCIEGIDRRWYADRFASDVMVDFPALHDLAERGLATIDPDRIALTEDGLGWSDAIGPWFYSPAVNARMEAYDLR